MIQHERRQQGVAELVSEVLGGDVDAISKAGALAQPKTKNVGLVPKLTDWEYRLHGRGCCITNRLTGEKIDVDFYDGSAEWFDEYFYVKWLESLQYPEFVEQRVKALHPTLSAVRVAIDELLGLGLLHGRPNSNVVRLSPECRAWLDGIKQLTQQCTDAAACRRVGAILGDWFLVREYGGRGRPEAQHLQKIIDRRRVQLSRLFSDEHTRRFAFCGLVDLGGDEASSTIASALQGPLDGTISAALKVLDSRENENWSGEVLQLLRRTDPNGEIPQPHIWITGARYILRHDPVNQEIRDRLKHINQRSVGDVAILALEYFPREAISLFRRALRSTVPNDRMQAAAALAILNQPWSRIELAKVLAECDDQDATAECRAALKSLPDAESQSVVSQWELRNPHEPETGPFISMGEMALRTADGWLQSTVERLHDRVLPLRKNVPPSDL